MTTSIEDLLNGSAPAPKSAAPAAEPIQPEPPEPVDETPPQVAAEAATGEPEPIAPPAAPPAATVEEPLDKKISAFQRKAEDETRKRQEYERKLQEAEKAIQERDAYIKQIAANQKQQADELDVYDPEQLQKYVQSIAAQQVQGLQAGFVEQKIVASQEFMRTAKDDYSEMEDIFAEEMVAREARGDFSLRQRMEADPFPAKFVYEYAKKVKVMKEVGDDPASYEQRIIEKYLASQGQTAQPAASVQTPAKPVPQPPKSLASVPSAARNVNRQSWKGPTPLDQLLN